MALIQYGGGIVQMSGSIAGNTHARNRFGNYTRARTKPINPNTDRQAAARARIMDLAEQWGQDPMDDAKRAAWETYANAVAMQNRLGQVIHLSGFNHYIRSNAAILAAGGTRVDDAPTTLSLPDADPTFTVTGSAASGQLSVQFDDSLDWANEDGGYLLVHMHIPMIPTRNFLGGPWRVAGAIAGQSGSPPTSPQTIDAPFTLVQGQLTVCKARIIRADGRVSNPFRCDPFVVGA